MPVINNSIRGEYHSQRNNMIIPHESCNTTSYIMWNKYNGFDFFCPHEKQPEDYLSEILQTDEAFRVMEERYPWARGSGFRPQEVHGMLVWGNTKLIGRPVSCFSDSMSIQEIGYRIARRETMVVSGLFGTFSHIVCLVGMKTSQADILTVRQIGDVITSRIQEFIIDDPYGDFRTNYRDYHGDDVRMTFEEFNRIVKKRNNVSDKWVHFKIC